MTNSFAIDLFILGQIQNNTYLLSDSQTKRAIVIDPAAGTEELIDGIKHRQFHLEAIWITHAHFDHIAGVSSLLHAFGSDIPVYLHPDDLPLWESGAGARDFGFDFDPHAKPSAFFHDGQQLQFTTTTLKVFHTPGHSPGHVLLYWEDQQAAFCGDLIFYHGIGRTDLSYGSEEVLLNSIRKCVLPLPDTTTLYCGHGSSSTVGEERQNNPFL